MIAAWATSLLHWFGGFVHKRSRYDTRGDSNDGITQEHDHRWKDFPQRSHRSDVAKSHSGHRYDGVIDRSAQVGELCVRGVALYDVHECAYTRDKYEDEEEIDQNLIETSAEGFQKKVAFMEKTKESKHAKHADESEGTEQKHVARAREDERQIGRKGGDEVDDAEEAQGISHRSPCAVESCHIVESEDDGKDVFQNLKSHLKRVGEWGHTLHKSGDDAGQDAQDEHDVVGFSCRSVCQKDDAKEFFFI